jgi:hypothetical protein
MEGFVTYEKWTTHKRESERQFDLIKKKIEPLATKSEVKEGINDL